MGVLLSDDKLPVIEVGAGDIGFQHVYPTDTKQGWGLRISKLETSVENHPCKVSPEDFPLKQDILFFTFTTPQSLRSVIDMMEEGYEYMTKVQKILECQSEVVSTD